MNTCETCRFSTGWKRGWKRGWRAAGERISEVEFARRMGEDREDAGCESEASGREDEGAVTSHPPDSAPVATAGPYTTYLANGYWFLQGDPSPMLGSWSDGVRANDVARALNAAYRAGQASMEPTDYNEGFEEGWKAGRTSTREPTEAMVDAGRTAALLIVEEGAGVYTRLVRVVWDAMWKARDA